GRGGAEETRRVRAGGRGGDEETRRVREQEEEEEMKRPGGSERAGGEEEMIEKRPGGLISLFSHLVPSPHHACLQTGGEKQLPNPLLLHRLASFQRVWSLPPSEFTGKEITALAWRPDGKILAFHLKDTQQVVLCGVEKAEILHVALSSFYNSEDESKLFLPKLPTLPKSYSTTSKIFSEEKSDEIMNLLGEAERPRPRRRLWLRGAVCVRMYKIATLTGVSGSCRSLSLSGDLKSLSVITEVKSADNQLQICYLQLDTCLLSSCLPEVTRMSRKFTHISTLLQYLHLSLTCMCEAWEDILLQMDLRLTKFVQEKNTSTQVQDEFLELLLPELQALLMNQLTVKGLKKLGQSIESSYSSIQKLVISHLQSGSEALLYHLSEVRGMSLWKQKFEPLGLDAAALEGAITAVGSFSLKANELLQVIDKSMKNFKAFSAGCEEHVPPELNKMTQKDIAFVADFLSEHFSEGNQWLRFLQESAHLKESPLLFPSFPQKSLHFVKRMMESVIEQCLQKPAEVIGRSVTQAVFLPLYTVPGSSENTPRLFELPSLWNDKKKQNASRGVLHAGGFPLQSVPAAQRNRPAQTHPSQRDLDGPVSSSGGRGRRCRSASEEEGRRRVLAQLPLSAALSNEEGEEFSWEPGLRLDQQSGSVPCQSLVLGNQWRELENMKAQFVAVNGIRKVACVMDVEDEDEEGGESQNASADQEVLESTMTSEGPEGKEEEEEGGGNKMEEQLESEEALDIS
ncbi:hypothetical protein F7725_027131, partial [Dissostichus mawsoni]